MAFLVPFLLDEDTSGVVVIGGVTTDQSADGFVIDGDPDVLVIGGVETDQTADGFQSPPDTEPLYQRPVKIGGVNSGAIAYGFTIPDVVASVVDPLDPSDLEPSIPYLDLLLSTAVKVTGYPDVTTVQAQPQWNGTGVGTFETPLPGPDVNEIVGVDVGGVRHFTGHVMSVRRTEVTDNEDAGELATAELEGLLGEWRNVLLLPDLGAQDVSLLSEPVQDERVFDWTMNGLGTDDAEGVAGINIVGSHSMSMIEGATSNMFPLPDVWPDPWARWMWVSNLRNSQRTGYCHFRVPFSMGSTRRRKVQVWAATSDYCQVWIDGVQVLECDTAFVSKSIDLDMTGKFHLVTIRAYNELFRSGVLFSILPVDDDHDGLYGEPFMNSRSGWKSLAYPTRSFRLNPGQVLRRFQLEAARRGCAYVQDWSFTFNESVDSAGRPWPTNDPITLNVGLTGLEVLDRLAEDLIDYRAAPAGKVLDVFVKDRGSGIVRSSRWVEGQNMTARETEETIQPWS